MIINDIGRKAAIMAESGNSYQKIYEIVKQIPKGCVASYGQVAALAGNPRWARVVGYALHVNPDPAHSGDRAFEKGVSGHGMFTGL